MKLLYFYIQPREAEIHENRETMQTNCQTVLCMNIVEFVFDLAITIGIIVYLVHFYRS